MNRDSAEARTVQARLSSVPLAAAATANAAAGTLFSWSVLLPPLTVEFSASAGELGRVFSTALVVFALALLVSGGSVDRFGTRRAAAVAGILSGGGLLLAAAAPSVLALHLGIGVLFGFGSGLTYLSAVTWASTRAGRGSSWAVGIVVAAYAAGPVAAAPLGTAAIDGWGWRTTLGAAALMVSAVTLVASRWLPGPVAGVAASQGSQRSQRSQGSQATRRRRRRRRRRRPTVSLGDRPALVALWLLFVGAVAPGLMAFAYAAQIVAEQGATVQVAGWVVALMAVGNLTGRLLSVPLLSLVGVTSALWAQLVVLLVVLAALAWLSSVAVVVIGLPLLSLQYGAVSALLPAATRAVATQERFGAAYGRVFSSWGVAGVLGPTMFAVLHDSGSYARGFQAALLWAGLAVLGLAAYHQRAARTLDRVTA